MNLSRKFLAGAILALLPLTGALACTTSAWTSTSGTPLAEDPQVNNANNNNPDNGDVRRYANNCGLRASAVGDFVTNDTPNDTIYRVRYYAQPTMTAGTAKIFSATSADAGGGTEIFSVSYDAAADEFDFTATGATVASATGIVPDKWYSIEVLHQSGQTLSVTVTAGAAANGAAGAVQNISSVGTVTGTVSSARLGIVDGAGITGQVFFDEFDSTRSAATPIGRLRRGDANNSCITTPANPGLSVADAVLVRNEVATATGPTPALVLGQPNFNEDTGTTIADAVLIRNAVALGQTACSLP